LRGGEKVSPEEIAAAQAAAASANTSTNVPAAQTKTAPVTEEENEWLPEDLKRKRSNKERRTKGRRRR